MSSGANLLIIQGGGPTPVFNVSLAAVIEEAIHSKRIGKVFGAKFGASSFAQGDFIDLSDTTPRDLESLRQSPGAALGSTRYKPSTDDLNRMVQHLRRADIQYVVWIGGNGTMRGAEMLGTFCRDGKQDLQVIGVPKTVDNDVACTDRCPGYGSAARYVAQTTRDLGMDVRSLPQPVSIYETMGRSVGWLAAASVLAKREDGDAPHLVYLPERPFSMDAFLSDVDRLVARQGWVVVVASEGIRYQDGTLVHQTANSSQADALNRPLTGGVGEFLAGVLARQLKVRCRSEKPGLIGRASMLHTSPRDVADADLVGRSAVRALLAGHSGEMVALTPVQSGEEASHKMVPLCDVAGIDRPIPANWLAESSLSVNADFLNYLRPLIGGLQDYLSPLKFSMESFGVH